MYTEAKEATKIRTDEKGVCSYICRAYTDNSQSRIHGSEKSII